MLIRGDARYLPLRDETVDCVVTSPPSVIQSAGGLVEVVAAGDVFVGVRAIGDLSCRAVLVREVPIPCDFSSVVPATSLPVAKGERVLGIGSLDAQVWKKLAKDTLCVGV